MKNTLWMTLALLLAAGPAEAGKKKKGKADDAPKAEEPAAEAAPAEGTEGDHPEGPEITLPCSWETGDSWTYEVVRTRGEPGAEPWSSTYGVDLEVVAVDGDTTVFSWSEGKPSYSEGALDNPRVKMLADLPYDETPMEITVVQGSVTGVRNLDAVLAANEKTVDAMLKQMPGPEAAKAQAREMMMKPEIVLGSALKTPQTVFAGNCMQLRVGESVSVPVQLPNPMGGGPLDATLTAALPEHDDAAKTAVVTLDTAVTPESLDAMVADLMKQMAAQMGVPEAAAGSIPRPTIEMTNTTRSVYALADGMPTDVIAEITADMMGQSKLDRWEISQQESGE